MTEATLVLPLRASTDRDLRPEPPPSPRFWSRVQRTPSAHPSPTTSRASTPAQRWGIRLAVSDFEAGAYIGRVEVGG